MKAAWIRQPLRPTLLAIGALLLTGTIVQSQGTTSDEISVAETVEAEPTKAPLTIPPNLTFKASRLTPWCTISGEFDIPIREIGGVQDLKNLQVDIYGPYLMLDGKDEPALQPVVSKLEVSDRHGLPLPDTGLEVSAGQQAPVRLRIDDLRHTGRLRFDLVLDTPSPEAPITSSFTLLVKDGLLVPLLVITLGVLLAVVIRYNSLLVPQKKNSQRISDLRGHLRTESNRAAPNLEQRLSNAEKRNKIGINALQVAMTLDQLDSETGRSTQQPLAPEVSKQLQRQELFLGFLSALLAVLVGLQVLYLQVDTFGTAGDYLNAFLWGTGSDTALRGLGGAVTLIETLNENEPGRQSQPSSETQS